MDVHLRLSKQDGLEFPQPLYAVLSSQARFTKRYSELLTAAGEGKGLSQVCTYSPTNEYHTAGEAAENQGHESEDTVDSTYNSKQQEEHIVTQPSALVAEHEDAGQLNIDLPQGQNLERGLEHEPNTQLSEKLTEENTEIAISSTVKEEVLDTGKQDSNVDEHELDEEDDELLPADDDELLPDDDEVDNELGDQNDIHNLSHPSGEDAGTYSLRSQLHIEEILENEASVTLAAEEISEPDDHEGDQENSHQDFNNVDYSEYYDEEDLSAPEEEEVELDVGDRQSAVSGVEASTSPGRVPTQAGIASFDEDPVDYVEEEFSAIHQTQVTVMDNIDDAHNDAYARELHTNIGKFSFLFSPCN